MSKADGPTVLFIAGSGRSGTTLVERMLGGIPGYVNVGELIDLFRRVYAEDERCGCGERFSTCAFWQEVGDRAYGGWSPGVVEGVTRLQRRVARQRYLPSHVLPQSAAFKRTTAEYGEHYAQLYRAIAKTAGASVVVDASKWPVQALALSRSIADLRVVHVERDIRGVAWSMSARSVPRPQSAGTDRMARQGAVPSALRWSSCQAQMQLVKSSLPVARVRYEDLTVDAHGQISQLAQQLDLLVPLGGLDHIRDTSVDLAPSHGLSGNPSRFQSGTVELRVDEAWRQQMPGLQRAVVAAIGAPLRLRRQTGQSRA